MTPGHEKLLGIITEHVNAARPDLTSGQRKGIAEAIANSADFETARTENWSFPLAGSDELKWQVKHALKNQPGLARDVPSAAQIALALAKDWTAKHGDCDPMQRIAWVRQAESASPDGRLAMSEGLTIEAATVVSVKDRPRTHADMTPDELDEVLAKRLGKSFDEYRRTTWETDRARYRAALRTEARKQEPERTPLVVDETFQKRPPMERIAAARASNGQTAIKVDTKPAGAPIDTADPTWQALSPGERINRWRAQAAKKK